MSWTGNLPIFDIDSYTSSYLNVVTTTRGKF